jgi:filamentous hemagglutinin
VFAGLGLGGLAADGFGALLPEAEPLALESEVPPQLTAGQEFEAYQLDLAGLNKNSTVLRPTPDQVNSATFRAVVGNPAYTPGGQLRGTIFDSVDNGYFEIKGGSSPLDTSYQLRLQTYFSLTDGEPFTIITSRPIAPSFQQYLDFWGVNVVSPVE